MWFQNLYLWVKCLFKIEDVKTLFSSIFVFSLCPDSGVSTTQAETDSCMSVLHFNVTPGMAPLSRLLVYYVRDNGEGVTDSLQLPVQPRFENEVGFLPDFEYSKGQ